MSKSNEKMERKAYWKTLVVWPLSIFVTGLIYPGFGLLVSDKSMSTCSSLQFYWSPNILLCLGFFTIALASCIRWLSFKRALWLHVLQLLGCIYIAYWFLLAFHIIYACIEKNDLTKLWPMPLVWIISVITTYWYHIRIKIPVVIQLSKERYDFINMRYRVTKPVRRPVHAGVNVPQYVSSGIVIGVGICLLAYTSPKFNEPLIMCIVGWFLAWCCFVLISGVILEAWMIYCKEREVGKPMLIAEMC